MKKSAIFASNTSTISINELNKFSSSPENFIGIHFFSPVDRMELVEIIKTKKTSAETLSCVFDFIRKINKTPIIVNDSPGFYTTRVFENNTTKEYLAFETPENTMISKIMLKSYNDLKTINPVTKMILKNSENNVLLNTEFGVENLRQNIISEKIKGPKNKTNTHSYTLEVTDPNTIDEATLIMSKRNYVLEVHYNGY